MPRQYSPEFRQRALRLLDTVMEASEVSEFEAIKVCGRQTQYFGGVSASVVPQRPKSTRVNVPV